MKNEYINKVIDLTDPSKNVIYNMTHDEAVEIVRSGNAEAVRKIDGQFSIVAVDGKTVRMALLYLCKIPDQGRRESLLGAY